MTIILRDLFRSLDRSRKKKQEQKKPIDAIVKRLAKMALSIRTRRVASSRRRNLRRRNRRRKARRHPHRIPHHLTPHLVLIPRANPRVPQATVRRRNPRRRRRRSLHRTINPLPQPRVNREKRRKFRNSQTVWKHPTRP